MDELTIGDWTVLPMQGRLVRGEEVRRIRPRAMDVLLLLADAPGEVREREELLAIAWGRTPVSDEPLTAAIAELRRAFGDRRVAPEYIETIPKRGYRLIAPVARPSAGASAPSVPEEKPVGAAGSGSREDLPRPEPRPPRARARGRRLAPLAAAIPVLVLFAMFVLLRPSGGERPASGPSAPPRAIAVLPFTAGALAADDAYLAAGLGAEIRTLLTRIDTLQVAAPSSVATAVAETTDPRRLREMLAVDALLEGGVEREDDRVRVTLQLVDARTGFQLWADRYERPLESVFMLQRELATAVTAALRLELLDREAERLALGTAPSGAAHELYLRGLYASEGGDEDALRAAIAWQDQAIALDPGFAAAHASRAAAWAQLADYALVPAMTGYEEARDAARRALDLEPDLAEAHWVLGWVSLYHDRDLEAAESALGRALALRPGSARLLSSNAALAFSRGRIDDALALMDRARVLDPLNAAVYYNTAYFAYAAGRLDLALRSARRTVDLAPQHFGVHLLLAQVHAERGTLEAAAREVEQEAHPLLALMGRAMVADRMGRAADAAAFVRELEERHATDAAYQIAQVHAWRGDTEAALHWLSRAVEQGDPGLLEVAADRILSPLRRDPRFVQLMARAGLPAPS